MSQTYYPTALDLAYFLKQAVPDLPDGSALPDGTRRFLEVQVNAARQELERACGRVFLAGAAALRRFDPPDNDLATLFIPDLCSVTSVIYQPEGGTAETLTLNEDYWLEPSDAEERGQPWTSIDFARFVPVQPRGANRRSLRITGRWGYGTTLPEAVWLAILARAGGLLYQSYRLGQTGGILSWSEGDLRIDYGVEPAKAMLAAWDAQYQSVVAQYRRLTF